MQKLQRSNSISAAQYSAGDVTVLWHGWLKKLGRFSKRWRKRYFLFVSHADGTKEFRHYDHCKDVPTLLTSTPKGIISLTDATGICCFAAPSPQASKKSTMFTRTEGNDNANPDVQDQKFAILSPLHVNLLAFHYGKEWGSGTESQQGLSLLATLSAFYPTVEVLHSGFMSKRRERTVHGPKSIMSYWKRHYFVFLNSGDLLYFPDETLSVLQGRVDVRHAPTVRVTGERMIEEKKKESLFKFSKLPAFERENCLVWIATPPSKMFVLKVQDEHEGFNAGSKKYELSPSAKKWLSLLVKGHAETKYTQLEQCINHGKYEQTPEIISAIRAGIPDELRGQLWKGFSGAEELQRRSEQKRLTRRPSFPRSNSNSTTTGDRVGIFDEYAAPLDTNLLHLPENQMIFSRLSAISLHETNQEMSNRLKTLKSSDKKDTPDSTDVNSSSGVSTSNIAEVQTKDHDSLKKTEGEKLTRHSLKQTGKSKLGTYLYPSDCPAQEWEISSRRRLLIAMSRYNPYSHPCVWRVACLLLAYMDEESAFWLMNSITDILLPGYFHGYRSALQIDVSAFEALLQSRAPTLYSHLKTIEFPIDRLIERWFLSLFTSSLIPLATVLRIWDAFFIQGLRIFFGIGMALLLKAEEQLFRSKTADEADQILRSVERNTIDADAIFAHVFKDDLNITWLTDEHLEKVRTTHRKRVIETVTQNIEHFTEKISVLSQSQDVCARYSIAVERFVVKIEQENKHRQKNDENRSSNIWNIDEVDEDDKHAKDSLYLSFTELRGQLQAASEAAANLATEFNKRQSKWLALSSQLSSCPLARLPNSDLQSWLWQVKEGKISGAENDSYGLPEKDPTALAYGGFYSAERIMECSELSLDPENPQSYSCLMNTRDDMKLSHRVLSEVFLYALFSALKASCTVRLECLATGHRYMWHGGKWIDGLMEFPNSSQDSPTMRKTFQTSNMTSSNSLIKRKSKTAEDTDSLMKKRASVGEDTRLIGCPRTSGPMSSVINPAADLYGTRTLPITVVQNSSVHEMAAHLEDDMNISSLAHELELELINQHQQCMKRTLNDLTSYYLDGELVFRTACDNIMNCFSKFIRLEIRIKGWELRERATVLEEDLEQELRDTETEIRGSQWLNL